MFKKEMEYALCGL